MYVYGSAFLQCVLWPKMIDENQSKWKFFIFQELSKKKVEREFLRIFFLSARDRVAGVSLSNIEWPIMAWLRTQQV